MYKFEWSTKYKRTIWEGGVDMEGKEKIGKDESHWKSALSTAWQTVELVDWNIADEVFLKKK